MPARRRRRPLFTWDARVSRFRRTATGTFLSQASVRRAFELALARTAREAHDLAEALRDGDVTLAEFQLEMVDLMRDAHLYAAAIARGGRLTQSDYGRLGNLLRGQYGYLRRFGEQLAAGQVVLDGRFLRRVASYVHMARQSRHLAERVEMQQEQGFVYERNVLGDAEHCDGCVAETARGWVPIGMLRPLGTRDCLGNDVCHVEYGGPEVLEDAA